MLLSCARLMIMQELPLIMPCIIILVALVVLCCHCCNIFAVVVVAVVLGVVAIVVLLFFLLLLLLLFLLLLLLFLVIIFFPLLSLLCSFLFLSPATARLLPIAFSDSLCPNWIISIILTTCCLWGAN